MTEPLWYSSSVSLPPLRAPVVVHWEAREFPAMRVVHPTRQRAVWMTVIDGEIVYLPQPKDRRRWGEHPACWRPRDPAAWPFPLPEPTRPPHRVSAADAAADSGSQEPTDAIGADKARQWWRDASAVTYSPPGSITAREAEARVKRAILTDGLRPEKNAGLTVQGWPAELIEAARLIEDGPGDERPPRFEPSPRDIDDAIEAMRWFAALDPPEMRRKGEPIREKFVLLQVVLILRALDPPFTWDHAGRFIRRSGTRAQQLHAEAILRVTRVANGGFAYEHCQRDHVAELRRRNREAARA